MDTKILKTVGLATAVLLLTGAPLACKKAPTEKKTESALNKKVAQTPLEPIAGQSAFNQMYRPARQWAADALPLTLTAEEIPGIKNENGKAGMWTGVFVSPSRREARTLFYSAAEHGGVLRGVTMGGAQPWSGATTKSRPFNPTVFLIDSDDAYKTAMEKAGPWVSKHPDKKMALYLASGSSRPDPVWIMMWGDSKSGYLTFVNATTGKVMTNR